MRISRTAPGLMSSDQRGPLCEAALLKTAGSVPGLVLKGFGMRKEPDLAVEGDVGDYSTETYRNAITAAVASATLLFFPLLTPSEGTPNFHAPYPAPLCSGHRGHRINPHARKRNSLRGYSNLRRPPSDRVQIL